MKVCELVVTGEVSEEKAAVFGGLVEVVGGEDIALFAILAGSVDAAIVSDIVTGMVAYVVGVRPNVVDGEDVVCEVVIVEATPNVVNSVTDDVLGEVMVIESNVVSSVVAVPTGSAHIPVYTRQLKFHTCPMAHLLVLNLAAFILFNNFLFSHTSIHTFIAVHRKSQ